MLLLHFPGKCVTGASNEYFLTVESSVTDTQAKDYVVQISKALAF